MAIKNIRKQNASLIHISCLELNKPLWDPWNCRNIIISFSFYHCKFIRDIKNEMKYGVYMG